MSPGDVVYVELPRRTGPAGHEQHGRRPAIVCQATNATPRLSTIVLVPLTSNTSSVRFAGAVPIDKSTENGLAKDSVAMTHQITVVDKSRIDTSPIGKLSPEQLASVQQSLAELLGL